MIWTENKRLEGVYDELQTDDVIEQQAREQFGLIKPGEQPLSVLPAPAATALPTGLALRPGAGHPLDPDRRRRRRRLTARGEPTARP